MDETIPRYIVWSTDSVNQSDPFQRRWLLRQILMYGRSEDIRKVDFQEVKRELDQLHLSEPVERLWRSYLERSDGSL